MRKKIGGDMGKSTGTWKMVKGRKCDYSKFSRLKSLNTWQDETMHFFGNAMILLSYGAYATTRRGCKQ